MPSDEPNTKDEMAEIRALVINNTKLTLRLMDKLLSTPTDEPSVALPDSPLISVIMPVFNRDFIVGKAIASVLGQRYGKFELIVGDDASTDNTPGVIAEYSSDARVRLIRCEQQVGSAALSNRALALSSGEIITYLDSDNYMYPHCLETIAEAFAQTPRYSSLYTAHIWFDEDNDFVELRAPSYSFEEFARRRKTFDLNVFAHRRELYTLLGGFDERLTRLGDWDLIRRYSRVAPPRRLAVVTGHYNHGSWPRQSNSEPLASNEYFIGRKYPLRLRAAVRILYVAPDLFDIPTTSLDAEIRYMLAAGVRVEAWTEKPAPAPDTRPRTRVESNRPCQIHGGTLAEAIQAFKPDLIHVRWSDGPEDRVTALRDSGRPVTLHVQRLDFDSVRIGALAKQDFVKKVFLPPGGKASLPEPRGKLASVSVSFNAEQYFPQPRKDRRLVFRTDPALPENDLPAFLRAATLCPDHRFLLCLTRGAGDQGCAEALLELNRALGSAAEIHLDLPETAVAETMRLAGLYLHSFDPAGGAFQLPISIAEAMATGAYVLARFHEGAERYLASADRLYRSEEEAAAKIRATLSWTEDRWRNEARYSIDRAFSSYTDATAFRPMLTSWSAILKAPLADASLSRAQDGPVSVSFGERISFDRLGRGKDAVLAGFHPPENWGAWCSSIDPSLIVRLEHPRAGAAAVLSVAAQYFSPVKDETVTVPVAVNNQDVGVLELKTGIANPVQTLNLPAGLLDPRGLALVSFQVPALHCPSEHGSSSDRRFLGLGLFSILFDHAG